MARNTFSGPGGDRHLYCCGKRNINAFVSAWFGEPPNSRGWTMRQASRVGELRAVTSCGRGGGARATKYRGAFRCSRTRARDHAPGYGGDSWAPTTQPGGIARVRKSSVPSGTERAPKPTRGCNAPRGLRLLGCERFEGPAQPEVSRGKTALTTPRVTPYPQSHHFNIFGLLATGTQHVGFNSQENGLQYIECMHKIMEMLMFA